MYRYYVLFYEKYKLTSIRNWPSVSVRKTKHTTVQLAKIVFYEVLLLLF